MKYKLVTSLLVVAALVVATFSAATTTARPARAAAAFPVNGCPENPNKQPPCQDDVDLRRVQDQLRAEVQPRQQADHDREHPVDEVGMRQLALEEVGAERLQHAPADRGDRRAGQQVPPPLP